jgi:hypothetical protein
VKVRGWRCPIEEIRPVDYGRLQADTRQQRQLQQARAASANEKGASR